MVLDATLLNTQHYRVRIKGKVEQSRKGVVAIEKGAFGSPTLLTYYSTKDWSDPLVRACLRHPVTKADWATSRLFPGSPETCQMVRAYPTQSPPPADHPTRAFFDFDPREAGWRRPRGCQLHPMAGRRRWGLPNLWSHLGTSRIAGRRPTETEDTGGPRWLYASNCARRLTTMIVNSSSKIDWSFVIDCLTSPNKLFRSIKSLGRIAVFFFLLN